LGDARRIYVLDGSNIDMLGTREPDLEAALEL
jgi:3-dehydroquinate dehydratase